MTLYLVSGVGKTTLCFECQKGSDSLVIGSESEGITRYFAGRFEHFLKLEEYQRQEAREKSLTIYFNHFRVSSKNVLIDAHYSFWVNGMVKCVFPNASREFYSHIVYYNPTIDEIQNRHRKKWGKEKYTDQQLLEWISFEIEGLKNFSRKSGKEFTEIRENDLSGAVNILKKNTLLMN